MILLLLCPVEGDEVLLYSEAIGSVGERRFRLGLLARRLDFEGTFGARPGVEERRLALLLLEVARGSLLFLDALC